MGLMSGLRKLDDKVVARRDGLSRRDYLAKLSQSQFKSGYVHKEVFEELVELHDKVAALQVEIALARCEAVTRAASQGSSAPAAPKVGAASAPAAALAGSISATGV